MLSLFFTQFRHYFQGGSQSLMANMHVVNYKLQNCKYCFEALQCVEK